MPNLKRFLPFIFLTLLAVAIGSVAGFYLTPKYLEKSYSVVYLTSGDIYVGELTTFPRLILKNAYLLQLVRDPNDASKSNFQLTPLKDSLWAPEKIYLNPQEVIFYGPVGEESTVAKTLRESFSQ